MDSNSASENLRLAALVDAASSADERGEHRQAAAWFREALDAMPPDADRMRAAALVNLSQALQHLGDLDAAQAALEQARAHAAGDNPELAEVRVACLLSLTAVAVHRGRWAEALALATESLDAAVREKPELAGHPLMNLAAAHFETGRRDVAVDLATQALAAFETAGNDDACAETRQNLALMHLRSGRADAAEPLLAASQPHFDRTGNRHRAGIGYKALGVAAEDRGRAADAAAWYRRGLAAFTESGAVLEAADVQTMLARMSFAAGRYDEGDAQISTAFAAYAQRGLGLHCARIDFWHAALWESTLDRGDVPVPDIVARGAGLAVVSALAIDAVRHSFPNGSQRQQWNSGLAEPAVRLAFRYAVLAGDATLITDLVETQCAGATPALDAAGRAVRPTSAGQLEPLTLPDDFSPEGPVVLGVALAEVAAAAGLAVTPPPRLALPEGRIALADYIAAAELRYGRPIRDDRVLPA